MNCMLCVHSTFNSHSYKYCLQLLLVHFSEGKNITPSPFNLMAYTSCLMVWIFSRKWNNGETSTFFFIFWPKIRRLNIRFALQSFWSNCFISGFVILSWHLCFYICKRPFYSLLLSSTDYFKCSASLIYWIIQTPYSFENFLIWPYFKYLYHLFYMLYRFYCWIEGIILFANSI